MEVGERRGLSRARGGTSLLSVYLVFYLDKVLSHIEVESSEQKPVALEHEAWEAAAQHHQGVRDIDVWVQRYRVVGEEDCVSLVNP